MPADHEQRFDTPGPVRLQLKIPSGEIRAMTVDGEESTVRLEGPEKLIDATTVELSGDRLIVASSRRKTLTGVFSHFDERLRVEVRIPHHSRAEIATAAAEAVFEGTFASVAAKSASGGLTVIGEVEGDVSAKTVSGDVRLPRIGGDLDAQTVSGDVVADILAGSATVRSVSGNVHVASLREGKVNVHSVSGDVALGIAAGTNVDVDAASASGELSSEVPLSNLPGAGEGPTVVLRGNTVSGDFRVFRAA